MTKAVCILLFGAVTTNALSQIDTTLNDFYPLHLGDTWQYTNESGHISTYVQVAVLDTLLPNGYRYAAIGVPPHFTTGFGFDRIDSLLRVQWGGPCDTCTQIFYSCGGTAPTEISIYHLGDTVGSIWFNCDDWNGFLGPPYVRYAGIRHTTIFGASRDAMVFEFGYYDGSLKRYIFSVQDLLVRGIGRYSREYWWSGGYEELQGAIIAGVKYGTIVSVDKIVGTHPTQSALCQNYPNPFNSSTKIQFEVHNRDFVKLRVLDFLGREIATLAYGYLDAGTYEKEFDAHHLSSGTYFYMLQTSEGRITKRMILLK